MRIDCVGPWEAAFRRVAQSYQPNITGGAKALQDLPPQPEFVFIASIRNCTMVRIIEHRDEAPAGVHVVEFRVYPSPSDASRVLGYVVPYVASESGEWGRAHTTFEFGEPVDEAFLIALALCEKHDAEVLWVHDPAHLFPPDKRPVRDASPT